MNEWINCFAQNASFSATKKTIQNCSSTTKQRVSNFFFSIQNQKRFLIAELEVSQYFVFVHRSEKRKIFFHCIRSLCDASHSQQVIWIYLFLFYVFDLRTSTFVVFFRAVKIQHNGWQPLRICWWTFQFDIFDWYAWQDCKHSERISFVFIDLILNLCQIIRKFIPIQVHCI